MKVQKVYTVEVERDNRKSITYEGTLEELINTFKYTLECGKSWEHEKGNKKINTQPKTIKGLITNLNNATNNSASNGYSGTTYCLLD